MRYAILARKARAMRWPFRQKSLALEQGGRFQKTWSGLDGVRLEQLCTARTLPVRLASGSPLTICRRMGPRRRRMRFLHE